MTQDQVSIALGGAVCAAGFVLAALSRPADRPAAKGVALILFGVWFLYNLPWIYNPASPASIAYRAGLKGIEHRDVWAVTDALAGLLCLTLYSRPWIAAIWTLFAAMGVIHVVAEEAGFEAYSLVLNLLFCAQMAVLLFIGGRGLCDAVGMGLFYRQHRHGNAAGPARAASPKA